MEIWNSVSALCCDCDNDAAYWDEILGQGKVWYGVASDDAHSKNIVGNGFVMVKADKDYLIEDVKKLLDKEKSSDGELKFKTYELWQNSKRKLAMLFE